MTDVTVTFDGGTPGVDVAAGSNGIQSVVDTPAPKFQSGFHGAAQVVAGGSSNTTDCRCRVDTGNSGDQYLSIYLKENTAHTSSGNFCIFVSLCNSSNSIQISFRVGSAGEFNIRTGTSTIVRTGSSGEIPVNSEFRLDLQLTGTTCNWWLYKTDPEADPASSADLSGTFTFPSSTISRWIIGPNSSTALTKHWSYDTLRSSTSGRLPAYNPAPAGPTYKVWNGSAEVACTIKVWNGSSEVAVASVAVN
jgi:hypothetical protein